MSDTWLETASFSLCKGSVKLSIVIHADIPSISEFTKDMQLSGMPLPSGPLPPLPKELQSQIFETVVANATFEQSLLLRLVSSTSSAKHTPFYQFKSC